MKKIFFLTCCFISFIQVIGQFSGALNDENYIFNSQYFVSPQIHNPAFVGKRNLSNIGVRFKNYNNAYNKNAAYDIYLGNNSEMLKGAIGFAASNFSDDGIQNQEPNENLKLSLQYNYELEFLDNAQFIFGVAPGLIHYLPSVTEAEQQAITETYFKPNVDVGFLIQSENAFFSGAMHHANKPAFKYGGNSNNIVNLEYFLYGGLDLILGDALIFSPSAIFQNVNNFSIYQGTLALNIKDIVLLGAGYRNEINTQTQNPNNPVIPSRINHNLIFTLGAFIQNIQIAGTYDLYMGDSNSAIYNKQFEISLAYFINREIKVGNN